MEIKPQPHLLNLLFKSHNNICFCFGDWFKVGLKQNFSMKQNLDLETIQGFKTQEVFCDILQKDCFSKFQKTLMRTSVQDARRTTHKGREVNKSDVTQV